MVLSMSILYSPFPTQTSCPYFISEHGIAGPTSVMAWLEPAKSEVQIFRFIDAEILCIPATLIVYEFYF